MGFKPLLHCLDNEASHALKACMSEANIDFQLAPSHLHCRKAAERSIRTFNNHSIARLGSTNTNFTMNLWEKLLPQGLLTLNLLRCSIINHQLSVQAQVYGAFDFNRTPLAPAGAAWHQGMVHEKPILWGTCPPCRSCIITDDIESGYGQPVSSASSTHSYGSSLTPSCCSSFLPISSLRLSLTLPTYCVAHLQRRQHHIQNHLLPPASPVTVSQLAHLPPSAWPRVPVHGVRTSPRRAIRKSV
jgi:hypothetical protein